MEKVTGRGRFPGFGGWPESLGRELVLDAERPGFNLDLWADLVDDSYQDPALLPAPAVIAEEIAERLAAASLAAQELVISLSSPQPDEAPEGGLNRDSERG